VDAVAQSTPEKPGLQLQRPLAHVPWSLQLAGHAVAMPQLTPVKPGSQKQLPREHTP